MLALSGIQGLGVRDILRLVKTLIEKKITITAEAKGREGRCKSWASSISTGRGKKKRTASNFKKVF